MKKLINAMFALTALCLIGCADDPDAEPLKRDTDQVSVSYKTGATTQFTVRYNGPWEARVVCVDADETPAANWFTISPESGFGDGKDYQYITVTASRNAAGARKGYVYLKAQGVAEEQRVAISQEAGIFKVDEPKITGELKTFRKSAAQLDVKYDKAFGGETVEISTLLKGVSSGLSIREQYTTEIEMEGSGVISIPITGEPENLGRLECEVVVKLDGREIYNGTIGTTVRSSSEIMAMSFDLFIWGGDLINNKVGFTPVEGGKTADKSFKGTESEKYECTSGTDGTNDVFATMTEEFRKNRGMTGWSGNGVYEHPGYLKLGTGSKGGWIMTPAITGLPSTPTKIVVSFDICRYDGNAISDLMVAVEGAGVIQGSPLITLAVLPVSSPLKWTTLAYTVTDANNTTKFKISSANLAVGTARYMLDNIVVMTEAKPDIKDPLAKVDLTTLNVEATESSFDLKWSAVKNADLYEVELTDVTRPQFSYKKRVEIPEIKIENILPGYYDLKLTAVWTKDEKLNSEPVTKQITTKGVRTEPLDAPTNLGCTNKGYVMTGTWSASEGATGYHVILMDGATEIQQADVTVTNCNFGELAPAKTYTLKVKATFKPNSALDSQYATGEVKTLPHMTAPGLSIFAKSHGIAVVEWTLSTEALAEQAIVGNKDYYDFRVKNAAGQVVRSIDNFSKFNFAKYPNFRLVWGGLTPGVKYTMEMRRRALPATFDKYVDSEWVAVDVTTDPAPNKSGYLLYKDFDNFPCGAQPLYGAYGFSVGSTADFSDPDNVLLAEGDANSVYSQGVKATASYFGAYLPEWDMTDFSATSSNVAIGAGYVKLGSGGKPAWMTLPKIAALTAPTDIYLELESCPYMEPSASGDMMAPSNADLMEYFYITVEGGGQIASVAGETSASAVVDNGNTRVMLRNVMAAKMQAEGLTNTYRMTGHQIKITGATSDTRIKVYTSLVAVGSQNFRMWLDNIKVKKVN